MRAAAKLLFDCAGLSAPALLFFACPKKSNQKKRHPTTCPSPVARGSLRFSAQTGAAELAISDRSDSPRFSRSGPAMLGGVNGAGAHTLTPWCSRAPQAENGTARGLSDRAQRGINRAGSRLPPRAAPAGRGPRMARGNSAAPVFCRGAQGSRCAAPTKPWGAFSFRLFSLGKQRKGTCVRGSPRFQNRVRAAAHQK